MLSFDMEVQVRREKTPVQLRDNSFHARIGRTQIGQKAAEPLRSSGRFLRERIAPKPGGSFRRMHGSFSNSFQLASESFRATRIGKNKAQMLPTAHTNTHKHTRCRIESLDAALKLTNLTMDVHLRDAGVEVSRSSFDRKQFGARKKLGQKTLEKMSTRAGASHVYVYDEEQAQSTAAGRGAAWRANAASRVEKQTGKSPTKTNARVANVDGILVTSPRYDGTRGGRNTSKAHAAASREKVKMMLPGEILAPAPARQLPAAPTDKGNYKRKPRGGAEPRLRSQ